MEKYKGYYENLEKLSKKELIKKIKSGNIKLANRNKLIRDGEAQIRLIKRQLNNITDNIIVTSRSVKYYKGGKGGYTKNDSIE